MLLSTPPAPECSRPTPWRTWIAVCEKLAEQTEAAAQVR